MNEETPKTEDEANEDFVAKQYDTIVAVFPNERGKGAHVVIPGSLQRATIYGNPNEVLKIGVKDGRIRHAWVDGDAPDKAKTIEELEATLAPKIRKFLEEVHDRDPDLNNGIASTFKLRMGRVGYTDEDEPIFEMFVRITHEESI